MNFLQKELRLHALNAQLLALQASVRELEEELPYTPEPEKIWAMIGELQILLLRLRGEKSDLQATPTPPPSWAERLLLRVFRWSTSERWASRAGDS